ncbi:hypothetical protein D3C78_599060 [compost metagenome]
MLEPLNYQVPNLPSQEQSWRLHLDDRAGTDKAITKKALYRDFSATEKTIPIFSRGWWLDASAGADNWDVALVESNGKIIASLPYVLQKHMGFAMLTQPPLTQSLGPWMRESNARPPKKLGQQKDLMEALIAQLPRFDHYAQNWHYSQTNWLPFYWHGFKQTTRYTYVLNDLRDLNKVYAEFENSKRANIKKSQKLVDIVFDIPADEFYDNHRLTLAKRGAKISYSRDLFKRIHDAGYANNSARTVGAYDKSGNLHAALFVVWDAMSAYGLICTIDPDYLTHGAASLLNMAIIDFVADKTCKFDFEGSMSEPVERSFRQYGAVQIPYFAVSKTPSRLLKTYLFLKDLKSSES